MSFAPAVVTSGLTGFDQQLFDQLRRLHFVELLDAKIEELVGQFLHGGFIEVVLVDDALDKSLLTFCAVPVITVSAGQLMTVPVGVVGSSVAVGVTVAVGVRFDAIGFVWHETDLLNLFIDRLLEKGIDPLALGFDLSEIRQLDFDGGTETVAAVARKAELFAVVGAEFDCHDVRWVGGGHKKADLNGPASLVLGGGDSLRRLNRREDC